MKRLCSKDTFIATVVFSVSLCFLMLPFQIRADHATDQSSLVAHWPFDDGLNPTADVAGGNDAVLVGDTAFKILNLGGTQSDIAPIVGNVDALEFDGSGDRVDVEDSDALDLSESFTISGWVFLDDVDHEFSLINKYDGSLLNYSVAVAGGSNVPGTVLFGMSFDNVQLAVDQFVTGFKAECGPTINAQEGVCFVRTSTEAAISPQQWTHVAAVYDHGDARLRVYLDGKVDAEATLSLPPETSVATNSAPVSIGHRHTSPFGGPGADGRMDDLLVYDRALSEHEIQMLAQSIGLPPIADAGADQSIHLGDVVTLDGSASFDPDGDVPLQYRWTVAQPDGSEAALSNPESPTPTFHALLAGNYEATLIVTDNKGLASEADTAVISTYNSPPVADAGLDRPFGYVGETVTLDGSGSYDVDGDPLIDYRWRVVSGPGTLILGGPTAQLQAEDYGVIEVDLVVVDAFGAASEADRVVASCQATPRFTR